MSGGRAEQTARPHGAHTVPFQATAGPPPGSSATRCTPRPGLPCPCGHWACLWLSCSGCPWPGVLLDLPQYPGQAPAQHDGPRYPLIGGKNERSAARGTVTHGAPRSCHRGPRALPLPLREEMGAGWGPTCCPRPLASTWHAGTQGMKCAAPEAPPDAEERPEVRRAGHCPRLYELGRCQHLAPHGCRPPAQPASRPQGRTLTDNCCLKREWEQLDPRGRAHSQEVATE